MAPFARRNFLFLMAAFAWAGTSAITAFVFRVRFTVNLGKISADDFFSAQIRFEDNAGIEDLNHEYIRAGKLLGWTHARRENQLEWVYIFHSREDFESWESDLYSRGLVQKEGRPYRIERQAGIIPRWGAV